MSALTPIDTSHEYPATWDNKYWEIQDEVPGSQIEDVQGKVRKNISFWREVFKASYFVLDTIKSGYKLPLFYMPNNFCKGNHSSTQAHAKFVTESISKLLANLKKANEVQVVPATVLASIIGKVLSMALGLGPVARMIT